MGELEELRKRVAELEKLDEKRKRTEEALRESQRMLSTLMSNLPGMAYRCKNDQDWTMEFVSDGCLSLTGYFPDSLMWNRKVSYAQVVHPEDRQYVWDGVQAGVKSAKPFRLTYRIVRSDGEERWVFEQGIGIFGSGRELLALEGFITDITERIRAEETLRESDKKYRLMTENATDIIWIIDHYGRFVVISPSVERILGYTVDEIMSLRLKQLLTPESYRVVMRSIEKKIVFGGRAQEIPIDPITIELEYVRKNGSRVWCEVTTKFLFDSDHRSVGITGITRDITPRKIVEANLIREKEFSEKVINSLPGIFYIFDARGSLIRWNDNFERILGYSTEEIPRLQAFGVVPPQDRGLLKQMIQGVLKEGSHQTEISIRTKQGNEIPFFVSALGVQIDDATYILGTGVDLTLRKRAEKRIQHLNAVLSALLKVHELITRETDLRRLIEGICQNLIETRGYNYSWIALFDDGGDVKEIAVAGVAGSSVQSIGRFKEGKWTRCADRALRRAGLLVTSNPEKTCGDCLLAGTYSRQGAMTMRMEYGGKLYGLLSAAIPEDFIDDEMEQSLFMEITGEIAFALHTLELAEERSRSAQALKERRQELEDKTKSLEEVNTALKVLLKRREEDKTELEEKVLINIKELIDPYLEKLKATGLNRSQNTYVDIVESNLNDITSGFSRKLSPQYLGCSPAELQVANLVRQGRTTKEIAEALHVSSRTVEFHRKNLRTKLGLKNTKINLRTHLSLI